MLKTFYCIFLFIFLNIITFNALAATNAIGSFNGNLDGDIFDGEVTTALNNEPITITISSQTAGAGGLDNITGSFNLPNLNISASLVGTISTAGNFNVIFPTGATGDGVSGTFNGSTLTIPAGAFTFDDGANAVTLGGGNGLIFSGNSGGGGNIIIDPEEEASTTIKNSGSIRTEILGVTAPIQQHLVKTLHGPAKGIDFDQQGFLIEGESGLNAGDIRIGDIGIWASYNFRSVENDFARTAFESTSHTGLIGIDYSPNQRLVIGVALAYEDSETDTLFNNGELESNGYTISPYIGILLDDNWSLDASFGISKIENEQFRTLAGTRITSNPETDRFFFNGNLNGFSYINNWIIGGRFGFLYANVETEQFTESDGSIVGERRTKLGQIRLGGDVAYNLGNWEPYFSLMYEYDYMFDKVTLTTGAQPANDRDDLLLATGVRLFTENGLSGNFDYSKRLLREDFDEDSITFNIRYDF